MRSPEENYVRKAWKPKIRPAHSKLDLVWIIPEIIGSVGIITSALVFLFGHLNFDVDLWGSIFNVGLVVVVIELGIRTLMLGLRQFEEVFE